MPHAGGRCRGGGGGSGTGCLRIRERGARLWLVPGQREPTVRRQQRYQLTERLDRHVVRHENVLERVDRRVEGGDRLLRLLLDRLLLQLPLLQPLDVLLLAYPLNVPLLPAPLVDLELGSLADTDGSSSPPPGGSHPPAGSSPSSSITVQDGISSSAASFDSSFSISAVTASSFQLPLTYCFCVTMYAAVGLQLRLAATLPSDELPEGQCSVGLNWRGMRALPPLLRPTPSRPFSPPPSVGASLLQPAYGILSSAPFGFMSPLADTWEDSAVCSRFISTFPSAITSLQSSSTGCWCWCVAASPPTVLLSTKGTFTSGCPCWDESCDSWRYDCDSCESCESCESRESCDDCCDSGESVSIVTSTAPSSIITIGVSS
uniref:Uncharacterized protein n=1 Tax=Anopheles arabiensis TaxID=7173 RepID=A0A182IHW4_ANOAR